MSRARKTVVGGIVFDSGIEARRYQELCLLQAAGEISQLECHPEFLLQAKFKDAWGDKVKDVGFTADFKYWEGDHFVIEDVKPSNRKRWSRDFIVRWAWARKLNPELEFRIVSG